MVFIFNFLGKIMSKTKPNIDTSTQRKDLLGIPDKTQTYDPLGTLEYAWGNIVSSHEENFKKRLQNNEN